MLVFFIWYYSHLLTLTQNRTIFHNGSTGFRKGVSIKREQKAETRETRYLWRIGSYFYWMWPDFADMGQWTNIHFYEWFNSPEFSNKSADLLKVLHWFQFWKGNPVKNVVTSMSSTGNRWGYSTGKITSESSKEKPYYSLKDSFLTIE